MKTKKNTQKNGMGMMSGNKPACKNCKSTKKESSEMMMSKRKSNTKKNWIKGAIKNPGSLHKELGIPKGETIPVATLKSLANGKDPVKARQARLALTLRGLIKNK